MTENTDNKARAKVPAYITKINELAQQCINANLYEAQAIFNDGLKGSSVKNPVVYLVDGGGLTLDFVVNGKPKSLTITFVQEDAVIAMPETVNPELRKAPDIAPAEPAPKPLEIDAPIVTPVAQPTKPEMPLWGYVAIFVTLLALWLLVS